MNVFVSHGVQCTNCMLSKSSLFNLPLDITWELFDSLVTLVLLYGCEIWGIDNIGPIETFHTCIKFCKQILKLNKNTANCMALGELHGETKVERLIDTRIMGFWCKLVDGNDEAKIFNAMYSLSRKMCEANVYKPKWVTYVKNKIEMCGFSNME